MIEKNIRLQPHHARDLLVGRRSDGKRPKYQPPGYGSSSAHDSGSRSSSDDSHDRGGRQHRQAAQAAQTAAQKNAPDRPEGPPGGGDKGMTYTAPDPVRHHGSDTPTQIKEQIVLDEIRKKEKEQFDKDWGFEDKKVVAPKVIKPKYVDVKTGVPHLEDPITTTLQKKHFDPNTSQNVLLDRGGIFSNINPKEIVKDQAKKMVTNKILKELGLAGLHPFLGIGSWLLGKFAPNKKAALTKKLKSTIKPTFDKDSLLGTADWQGEKKRNKTFHEGEGGDKQQVTTVEEAISGKKALGIDFDELRKRHNILQTTLNDGYYVDNEGRTIQLNDEQKTMLTNYISQIDDYLVNVDTRTMSAYGGRIDKALGGRSRDI